MGIIPGVDGSNGRNITRKFAPWELIEREISWSSTEISPEKLAKVIADRDVKIAALEKAVGDLKTRLSELETEHDNLADRADGILP